MAEPNKYRKRISELQKQLRAAIIRGDKELEKKLRNELRAVASTPFDSRIRKINNAAQNRQRIQKNASLPVQRMNLQDPRNRLNNNSENDESTNNQAQNNPSVSKQALERYQEKPYGPNLGSTQQEPIGGKSLEPIRKPNPTTNQSDNVSTPDRRSTEDQNIPVNQLDDNGDDQAGDTGQGESKSGLVDRGREFIQKKLVDQAKKLALQIGKKIAVFFAENPYAILIVLGIIILIITALILFSYFMNRGSQSPAASGASFTQGADPVKDASWIAKFANLSGMSDISDENREKYLNGLTDELTQMKSDVENSQMQNKAEIINSIDELLKQISNFRANKDSETGKKIIENVKKVQKMIVTLPQINGIKTGFPFLDKSNQTITNNSTNFNRTPHYGTFGHSCKNYPGDCEKTHRTFQYFKKDVCDAADIGAKAGTEVHSMFAGTVIKDDPSKQGLWIEAKDSNGNTYVATYAHLDQKVSKGQSIREGDVIGTVKKMKSQKTGNDISHLHLELSVNGRCAVATAQENVDSKKGSGQAVGYIVWDRIKNTLKL